jgi:hypothetical protein
MEQKDYDTALAEWETIEPGHAARFLAFLTTYALEDLPMETAAPVVDKPAMLLVTGNTFPARGLLRMLGGDWIADRKVWMVPADKHAEAQAAVDRFTPKPATVATPENIAAAKSRIDPEQERRIAARTATPTLIAGTPSNPQQVPRNTSLPRTVVANVAPTAKPKKAKAPKLPPNALERRLQALLTGAELLRQDCPEGSRARSELFFVIEHIRQAIEGK